MNTKNFILILLLLLILITSGCGGGGDRNGTKPKPPEEIVEPAPPPIVVPNPPDNGSDPVPPDDNDENPCETGERQYHYDDGRETGVDAFKYPQCTYYAAKTFQNLAPEPGVNWGGNAGAWYKNAGENGWVTTNIKDDSRLVPGSIIVWGNHVQMVSDVFSDGIIVVGMNEGWSNEHDPLDPKHDKHSVGSYTNDNGKVITVYAYTGYVYRYCIPFDDFDSQSIYWGGPFRGYVLPIRQGDERAAVPETSSYSLDGARVITYKGTLDSDRKKYELVETTYFDLDSTLISGKRNESIIINFFNNAPFGHDEYVVSYYNLETGWGWEATWWQNPELHETEILPLTSAFGGQLWYVPGIYRISYYLGGELRAYQDIVINTDIGGP